MSYNSKGDLQTLTATYNEVAAGGLRGVDAFCRLLEIQSQLHLTHNLDPARDAAYSVLGTTQEKFRSLLCSQYFLAARQMYEGATDQHFLGANRSIQEALTDLHLVPVYMQIGKEAVGDKSPLGEESWREIGVSKFDYDALRSVRLTEEAKRVWGLAVSRTGNYPAFMNTVHEAGLLLRQAGLDLTGDKVYPALGVTREQFDIVLTTRQQEEQAKSLQNVRVVRVALG